MFVVHFALGGVMTKKNGTFYANLDFDAGDIPRVPPL